MEKMAEPGAGRDRLSSVRRTTTKAAIAGRSSLDDGFMADDTMHHEGRHPYMLRRIDAVKARAGSTAYGLGRSFQRVWLNPVAMGIVLVAALALGSGMAEPLVNEARARHGGIWFQATCAVEAYGYAAISHKVGRSLNVGSAVQRGAIIWTFFGAFNVTVTLADGCDGLPEHMPNPADAQRIVSAELDRGYFLVDIDGDSELEGDVSIRELHGGEGDSRELVVATTRVAAAVPAAGGGKPAAMGDGVDVVPATAADVVGARDKCTARESNLDHLRGRHLAYSDLVLTNANYCTGRVNASYEEGEEFCDRTAHFWLRPRPELGEAVPCWAFEKRLPNHRGHEVHIVLNRELSASIVLYLLYAVFVVLLLLHLLRLLARRTLQQYGLVDPDELDDAHQHEPRKRPRAFSTASQIAARETPAQPPMPPTFPSKGPFEGRDADELPLM